jgi:uncharacterized protein (TIGR02594 family)
MLTRRAACFGMVSGIALARSSLVQAQDTEESLQLLEFPPFEALDPIKPFGYEEPTQEQKDKVKEIINNTPKGPTPIDVAQSFIDRFATTDPEVISQWPKPQAWNPLVVAFFSETNLKVNNDMVAWCAAFANWCIERAQRTGTNSAASQSFLNQQFFAQTDDPKYGDLAVFTCYDKSTGKSVGLGHVAFFQEALENGRIKLLGGNQSGDGRSSIISVRSFTTGPVDVTRTIKGVRVICTRKLNTYVRIV